MQNLPFPSPVSRLFSWLTIIYHKVQWFLSHGFVNNFFCHADEALALPVIGFNHTVAFMSDSCAF